VLKPPVLIHADIGVARGSQLLLSSVHHSRESGTVRLPPMNPNENILKDPREASHVEGFAAEVAWCTHGGKSKLEKREIYPHHFHGLGCPSSLFSAISIRATSETAMYKVKSVLIVIYHWSNIRSGLLGQDPKPSRSSAETQPVEQCRKLSLVRMTVLLTLCRSSVSEPGVANFRLTLT
jgi:hypothetical protein